MVIKNRPFRRQGVGKQGGDVGRRGEATVLEASQRLSLPRATRSGQQSATSALQARRSSPMDGRASSFYVGFLDLNANLLFSPSKS